MFQKMIFLSVFTLSLASISLFSNESQAGPKGYTKGPDGKYVKITPKKEVKKCEKGYRQGIEGECIRDKDARKEEKARREAQREMRYGTKNEYQPSVGHRSPRR